MEVDSVSIYHLVCDVSAQVACVMSCVSSDYGGNLSLGAHYTGDGQVIRRHWTTLVHISSGQLLVCLKKSSRNSAEATHTQHTIPQFMKTTTPSSRAPGYCRSKEIFKGKYLK